MTRLGKQEDLRIFAEGAEDRKANPMVWAVRVLRPGDGYGRYDKDADTFTMTFTGALYGRPEPVVEFYDCRHSHTPFGQFVARYGASALFYDREKLAATGLCLDGGVPAWAISGRLIGHIMHWLERRIQPQSSICRWVGDIQQAYDNGDFATVGELLADGEMNDRIAQLKE